MIGIIGGSGFYNLFEQNKTELIHTPYGDVSIEIGTISDKEAIFIPRHGKNHSIPPSSINYRANIFAAHMLKVDKIYATNAYGSIRFENKPGSFVIPDQIIDFTHDREATFFDGQNTPIMTHKGRKLFGVIHTDVSDPFDNELRNNIQSACKYFDIEPIMGGTIVVVNGPRYETKAEIDAYRILGADYAGMTSAPEAFLAKELDIQYATLGILTNYAAGMQKEISHEEVTELFNQNIKRIKQIFTYLIKIS